MAGNGLLKGGSYLCKPTHCRREAEGLTQGLAACHNAPVPCLAVQSLHSCSSRAVLS